MALDYMDDSNEEMSEPVDSPAEEKSEGDTAKTALVNSDLCPGMKPGDEFTVRVEKVLDSGEYEISYPGEHETAEQESQEPQSAEAMEYMS